MRLENLRVYSDALLDLLQVSLRSAGQFACTEPRVCDHIPGCRKLNAPEPRWVAEIGNLAHKISGARLTRVLEHSPKQVVHLRLFSAW